MRRFISFFFLFALASVAAAWDRYTIRDIGSLPDGNATYANAINRAGHVVGATYLTYDGGAINAPSPVYYHHDELDNLGSTGSAEGINDHNHVVGFLYDSLTSSDFHAFYHEDGHMHDLGTLPGDQDSLAYGINETNEIVGYSANDHVHAFVYDRVMHALGTLPGDTDSIAAGINNRGQIVGQSYKTVQSGTSSYSPGHAFLYEHGHMHDIGSLPNTNVSSAAAINDRGHIVGSANYATLTDTGPSHAFLYDGTMHDLGTLGGPQSFASAINKSGVIVGSSEIAGDPSNPQSDAFVYRDGKMRDLNGLVNLPKTTWTQLWQANGINERGQITGWGFNANGLRSFIVTPVPVAMQELVDQLAVTPGAEIALGYAEIAKTSYDAEDLPGACSNIASTLEHLSKFERPAVSVAQISANVTAISIAMECDSGV